MSGAYDLYPEAWSGEGAATPDPATLVHAGLWVGDLVDVLARLSGSKDPSATMATSITPLCGSTTGATTPYAESVTCSACKGRREELS